MDHIITTLTELQSRLTNVIRTKDTNFVWSWEIVKTTDDLQLTDIVFSFDIVSQKMFAPQRNGEAHLDPISTEVLLQVRNSDVSPMGLQ